MRQVIVVRTSALHKETKPILAKRNVLAVGGCPERVRKFVDNKIEKFIRITKVRRIKPDVAMRLSKCYDGRGKRRTIFAQAMTAMLFLFSDSR